MTTTSQETKGAEERLAWEEESGLLRFLSSVHEQVTRFEKTFDFGVAPLPGQPRSIDGSEKSIGSPGFVVLRGNRAVIGRDYCLYSLLKEKTLYGYIGVYADGVIETVRELRPMRDFKEATALLHGWLRELVKASCEKI